MIINHSFLLYKHGKVISSREVLMEVINWTVFSNKLVLTIHVSTHARFKKVIGFNQPVTPK